MTVYGIIFLLSIMYWCVVIFFTYMLPGWVLVCEKQAAKLPVIIKVIINIGHSIQMVSIVLYPLLFLITIGSLVLFVVAAVKKQ